MVSCKVLTIANDNEKYKSHMFVILFIHCSSFCILCLNVLYHSLITIGLITLKHLHVDFCIQSLFLFVHGNGGFDPHMYISLYLFTVHLLYNHCILIRYSYYIVVTYVDFIVSHYFFISDHELITISFYSIE